MTRASAGAILIGMKSKSSKTVRLDRWMQARREVLRKELPKASFLQICVIAADQWVEQQWLAALFAEGK